LSSVFSGKIFGAVSKHVLTLGPVVGVTAPAGAAGDATANELFAVCVPTQRERLGEYGSGSHVPQNYVTVIEPRVLTAGLAEEDQF
jgi:hypothetical protein